MAPNTPNQGARRSASKDSPSPSYDIDAMNVADIYAEDGEDDFLETSPNTRSQFPRRKAMNDQDIRTVRSALQLRDIYADDEEEEEEDNGRVYRLDCDILPISTTTGTLLDISAKLELRGYDDDEGPWRDVDPWKKSSTDSLNELVEQMSKTEEQRKLSLTPGKLQKAIHPRVSDIKRTWRSTDSLCNMIEKTTSSMWKSSDTLSNLVDTYASSRASSSSSFSSSSSSSSSYGSTFNPLGQNKAQTNQVTSARSNDDDINKKGLVQSMNNISLSSFTEMFFSPGPPSLSVNKRAANTNYATREPTTYSSHEADCLVDLLKN